jgi:hypothetical protein
MKRFLIIFSLLVFGVAVFLGAVQFARDQRPEVPQSWFRLYRGMTPEQVRSTVSDEVYDLRAVQGLDVVKHMGKYGHWQLLVRYDSSGHVLSATASYLHTFGHGLLNTAGIRIL